MTMPPVLVGSAARLRAAAALRGLNEKFRAEPSGGEGRKRMVEASAWLGDTLHPTATGLLIALTGALVAEALAARGRRVTFVTPYETVMPYGGISHRMETPDLLRSGSPGSSPRG